MRMHRADAATGRQAAAVGDGERGSVTIWSLGLVIAILLVGGIGLDLWRAVSDRQRLASIADAAAVAGATAVDPGSVRTPSTPVRLDESLARDRAWEALAAQPEASGAVAAAVRVEPDAVEVAVDGRLNLTLLRVLYPADALTFRVTGSAGPVVPDPD